MATGLILQVGVREKIMSLETNQLQRLITQGGGQHLQSGHGLLQLEFVPQQKTIVIRGILRNVGSNLLDHVACEGLQRVEEGGAEVTKAGDRATRKGLEIVNTRQRPHRVEGMCLANGGQVCKLGHVHLRANRWIDRTKSPILTQVDTDYALNNGGHVRDIRRSDVIVAGGGPRMDQRDTNAGYFAVDVNWGLDILRVEAHLFEETWRARRRRQVKSCDSVTGAMSSAQLSCGEGEPLSRSPSWRYTRRYRC